MTTLIRAKLKKSDGQMYSMKYKIVVKIADNYFRIKIGFIKLI